MVVDTVAVADPRYFVGGRYVVPDTSCGSRPDWYYSVLSIDERGDASGRTNITYHELDALDPPPPPALDHPADLGRVTSPDVTFQWFRQPTGASWYWLEVSYDSTFADAIVDSTIIDTVRVVRLPRAGDVWWRVRAKHYSPWGSYSEVRRCTFAATGVRMDGEIPDEPFLGQNYPNPFNPQTTIRFGLRSAGWVRISVLDLLGQEVAVLANESREPGTHAITWDASRYSGGTYFYRMTAGRVVVTKKLLLIR